MGMIRNLLTGGKRPTVEGDTVRCGECKETIQPDADRCPHCGSDVFTLKGRIVSRTSILFGLIFFVNGGTISITLGFLFVLIGLYYIWQAPIYYIKPPHQPERRINR